MAENRPRSRQKNITGGSKGVRKRGGGLNGGPVGNAGGYSGREERASSGNVGRGTRQRGTGSRSPLGLILLIVLVLAGGGGGLSMLTGSLSGGNFENSGQLSSGGSLTNESSLGNGNFLGGSVSSGWQNGANTGKLNTSVAAGAREKRTEILGDGQDIITVMVYMCGTDLESKYGMGTSDIQEMLAADLSENVNLVLYTGGCTNWKNNTVSNQVNQIYQVKDGKLRCLVEDAGDVSMTKPDTLTGFIRWCAENFPANRNELIFWDHGGGSISGYGYDQKYTGSGSMSLAGINQALKDAGVAFDFIGFDACLMATMENALMLSQYADYMIASEETEPGVGWYYTNWLTELAKDPSMATVEVGRKIADDFVDVCAARCQGQKTTLSVVDLAELETTVPQALSDFSRSTSQLIQQEEYKTVSDARSGAREFAQSSGIDQVDLVHLAGNMGTEDGRKLTDAVLGAVKYNRTSSNMTNAYGISIYFPYKKVSSVDKMVRTYEQIGMDEEYSRCIQEFASLEVSGQTAAGGTGSPLPSLIGSLGSSGGGAGSSELITQMLEGFLSGNFGGITGLDSSNTGFFSNKSMDMDSMAEYVAANRFDADQLIWQTGQDGRQILSLSEEQWSLVHSLELNMFFDDGEGYIDLGFDNVYEFDEEGNLIGDTDRTWLAINGQPVAYYYLDTVDDGENYTITGRVPALLNGERVNLILVFDNDHPYGYIAGVQDDYAEGETETVAKTLTGLQTGDILDFLCDYYSYDGTYRDSYYLGDSLTVTDDMIISNVDVGEGAVRVTYRFTDIYNQQYWTPAFTQ